MIAVVVALLSVAVAGLPIALALDPRSRGLRLAGTAFLLGTGAVAIVLFALSFAGAWSLPAMGAGLCTIALAAWFTRGRLAAEASPQLPAFTILSAIVDAALLATIAGYFVFTTLAAPGEWDFWAIWGLKARVFFEHGGIDWAFLRNPDNSFAHTDYPLLLPLNLVFLAFAQGEWNDRWLGLFFAVTATAGVLVVRDLMRREIRSQYLAALATLALAGPILSAPIGLADGLVMVFSGCGFLFVRNAFAGGASGALWAPLRSDGRPDAGALRTAAVLLGLGALSKNEGLAFLVALTAAAVITQPRGEQRRILRLWPAYALAATWLVPRAFASLATDLFSGRTLGERIVEKMTSFPTLLAALAENLPPYPWFWAGVIAAFAIAGSRAVARERLALMTISIQVLFYIGSYIASPHPPEWHVLHSWRRLVMHLVIPAGFTAFALVAAIFERENPPEDRIDERNENAAADAR